MGPNLESCALTRGNLRVCSGFNFSSFDKTSSRSSNGTIIGRNGVVCCLRMTALSPVIVVRSSVQKPATSARRDSARIDRPAPAAAPPEAAVPAGSTAGHPGHKVWQMPATAQQAPHPQADDSFAADETTHSQRMICWIGSPNGILLKKPFRAIILAAASHSPAKRIRGLLLQALGDRCAHCCLLRTLPAFGHFDRTTITGRSAVILRQHTTPFLPMIVPFDDLEPVYQSLRN
jgi:hypothetical protein